MNVTLTLLFSLFKAVSEPLNAQIPNFKFQIPIAWCLKFVF